MEFRIPQNVLCGALEKTSIALETKAEVEAFTKVRMDIDSNILTITANNRKMYVEVLTSCSPVTEKASFGVSGELLKNIVASLPDEEVRCQTLGRRDLEVLSGRSRYRLGLISSDEFLQRIVKDGLPWRQLNIKQFFKNISRVMFAAGKPDEARPHFACVALDKNLLVGSNGFRLAFIGNELMPLTNCTLLPVDSVQKAIKIFRGLGEEGMACIAGNMAHFAAGGVYLAMNVMSGEYPDVRRLVPAGTSDLKRFTLDRAALITALKRIQLVSEKGRIVNLDFIDGQLKISAKMSLGGGEEYVECSAAGPFMTAVNLQFLLETLDQLEDKTVSIDARSGEHPLVIKENGYVNIISVCRREGAEA